MVDHVPRKKILSRNDEYDGSGYTYKSSYGSICFDWNWKFQNRRLVYHHNETAFYFFDLDRIYVGFVGRLA